MRKSFVLYTESLNVLDVLTDEQAGKLFRVIRDYAKDGTLPDDPLMKVAFSNFRDYLDRDGKIYEERCRRGRENGKLGGRPPKEKKTDKTDIGFSETQKTDIGFLKPTETQKTDIRYVSDSDSVSVSDSVSDSDKERGDKSPTRRGRFSPPTVEEVREYCRERGNGIDAEQFIDFYQAKGWMVGKNKMKDWRASVRNWERRDTKERSDPLQQKFDALKGFGGDIDDFII